MEWREYGVQERVPPRCITEHAGEVLSEVRRVLLRERIIIIIIIIIIVAIIVIIIVIVVVVVIVIIITIIVIAMAKFSARSIEFSSSPAGEHYHRDHFCYRCCTCSRLLSFLLLYSIQGRQRGPTSSPAFRRRSRRPRPPPQSRGGPLRRRVGRR